MIKLGRPVELAYEAIEARGEYVRPLRRFAEVSQLRDAT